MSLLASMSKCPGCNKLCTKSPDKQYVVCKECSKKKKRVYQFCWACQREWPSRSSMEATCTLPNCAVRAALLSSEVISKPQSSVNGCPYFRACPNCKALLTHTGSGCPNIICPTCKMEFCFRCLRQNCFGRIMDIRDNMRDEHNFFRIHEMLLGQRCTTVDNRQTLDLLK